MVYLGKGDEGVFTWDTFIDWRIFWWEIYLINLVFET